MYQPFKLCFTVYLISCQKPLPIFSNYLFSDGGCRRETRMVILQKKFKSHLNQCLKPNIGWKRRLGEWLVPQDSDHEVPCSNPAEGRIQLITVRLFITAFSSSRYNFTECWKRTWSTHHYQHQTKMIKNVISHHGVPVTILSMHIKNIIACIHD